MKESKFKGYYYLPAIILVYSLIAIPGRAFYDKKELFPIFAWTLYTKTPSVVSRPTLKILEVDSMRLTRPIDIYDDYLSYGFTYRTLRYELESFYKASTMEDDSLRVKLSDDFRRVLKLKGVTSCQIIIETYYPYDKLMSNSNLSVRPLTDELKT